jgi:hypothetical protein
MAQRQMKEANQQIKQQIQEQKQREELKKIAARRTEKEVADRLATEAEAAEKAEDSRKKLEADRQKDQQDEEQKEEKRRRGQAEARKRPEDDQEARKRPEGERAEARKRPEDDREARRRPEDDRQARKRSEDDREARMRPEAGRAEAREREASWEGRHVRDRRVQGRLGTRKEERLGQPSGPEEAGLRPDYTIPRKDRSWKTTVTPSRSLPLTYEGHTIAIPRSQKEKLVFQQLLNRKMLFRAPKQVRTDVGSRTSGSSPESQPWTVRRLIGGGTGHQKGRKLLGRDTGTTRTDPTKVKIQ